MHLLAASSSSSIEWPKTLTSPAVLFGGVNIGGQNFHRGRLACAIRS